MILQEFFSHIQIESAQAMQSTLTSAQLRTRGRPMGAILRGFFALPVMGLMGLVLGFPSLAGAQGASRLSDGEVIKKLPCRASKYSSQLVCPAIVVAKTRPALTVRSGVAGVQGLSLAPLPAELLLIARQVERGTIGCELGAIVTVTELGHSPGYFSVSGHKFKFQMVPVLSSTGAIRLEDAQAGAVWLQLPEKSMLMSQKHGVRLADVCVAPLQAQTASVSAANPAPSLLDAHQPAGTADTSAVLITSTRAVAQTAK